MKFWRLPFALVALVCINGQIKPEPRLPFKLKWAAGKCLHCQYAWQLGYIQFTTRTEAWGIG